MTDSQSDADSKLGGNPSMARHLNDRIALELLARHGTLSRTQLRDQMGIAQPTAMEIVRRLERAGFIAPVGEELPTRPGPRAVLYGLVKNQHFVAAARVRDRKVAAVIGDVAGGPGLGTVVRTLDNSPLPDQIVAALDAAVAAAGTDGRAIHRTVVGVPGIVERATGDLGFAWDFTRWRGRLLEPLRAGLTAPVELVNGVDLVALAEGRAPRLETERTFALMWIGHGVGTGLVLGGELYFGSNGAAGQVGYMPVPGAPVLPVTPATGGFSGDLQALIGTAALRDLAREHGLAGSPATLVTRAAGSREPTLTAFLDEVSRRIAIGLAGITAVMDPGVVVLQGETGVAGGVVLAERVEQHLRTMSPLETRVIAAQLTTGEPELEGGLLLGRGKARQELWGGPSQGAGSAVRGIHSVPAL